MSLFGDLMSTAEGALTGNATDTTGTTGTANPVAAANPGLVTALLGLLGNQQSGGLSGLVQLFEQQGLGHLIASWIGNGNNLPISAQQVESVLGNGRLAALAQEAGIPPEQASSMLASVLPGLISHLTPTGTADHGLLAEGMELLRGRLG
jgi:uncharacterized protein YidB (DUF937 family)